MAAEDDVQVLANMYNYNIIVNVVHSLPVYQYCYKGNLQFFI